MTPDQIAQAVRVIIALLERYEGLYLKPYLCPAGVWTIGLGTTRYPDGNPVRPTDAPITPEQAYALASIQIRDDYLPAAMAACPGIDSPARLAAVVDFAYNLGSAALRGSTMRKRINAGDWASARVEVMKWVRGGGRVLPGLIKRRASERALM